MTNVHERSLRMWGKEAQMMQAVEEMSELIKELMKNINRKRDNLDDIIEETADVEVMLEHIKYCYDIEKQVADVKVKKIEKLTKKLEEWEARSHE